MRPMTTPAGMASILALILAAAPAFAAAPAAAPTAPPAAAPSPGAADDPVLDGIAAQVGSDIVLVSEVRNMVGPMETKMRAAGAPEAELAALRADALERLIERALIRQVVRRAELEATDPEVDTAIATIARENGLIAAAARRDRRGRGAPLRHLPRAHPRRDRAVRR